jgi:hypothetical protein
VSHEAIYQWVCAQPVSTLATELTGYAPGARPAGVGGRPPPATLIREPRYIDERPVEVAGQVPGQWVHTTARNRGDRSTANRFGRSRPAHAISCAATAR